MQRVLLAVLFLLVLCGPRVVAQTREFNQTAALEPGGTLVFETDKGSVKLTAWEQRQVVIYARIEPAEDTDADYARRSVEATRIDVSGDARNLSIRSNFDNVPTIAERWGGWSRRTPNIHYEIKAPRELNLRLTADRSRINVQGFTGKLSFETDRSPFEARELAGDIQLKVDRGEVRLDALRGSLALHTDRTNIRAEGLSIERDSRVNISRGEAELRVPASQALSVSARTGRRESFESEFGLLTSNFNKELIEGAINGGGPRLSVEGDRSKVYLRKQ